MYGLTPKKTPAQQEKSQAIEKLVRHCQCLKVIQVEDW